MYEFTIYLKGDAAATDEFTDAAYEAGCDDATFAVVNGEAHATFHREAETFADAVLSAIDDLACADSSVEVTRVERINEADDLMNLSEIGELTIPPRTRESIRKLVEGVRGPGGFPAPVSRHKRVAYWRRGDVEQWLERAGINHVSSESSPEATKDSEVLNSLLTLRRHRISSAEAKRLLDSLRPRTASRRRG